MSYGIKNSLLAWWILCILAIFLWCRNYKYDRVMSTLAFTIALIQLTEYGIYNNMNIRQGGKLIFMLVWLIVLILALSVLIYSKDIISFMWVIVISVLFMIICAYAITNENNDQKPKINGNKLEYGYVIDDIYWLYIASFFIPLLILLYHYGIDLYLMMILLYTLLSMMLVYYIFDKNVFLNVWLYSLIGLILISWFIGMFPFSV